MSNSFQRQPILPSSLCLFGAGGHGRVVAKQVAARFDSEICFGDDGYDVGQNVDGLGVKFQTIEDAKKHTVIVTIGDNAVRKNLQKKAEILGLTLGRIVIDDDRYFSDLPGPGSQVLAGAVVNNCASVGAGVIINSSAVVEHDTVIGDFSHLAPGSVVGGGASIGQGVLLGTNATVLPGISVATGCVIGAGSVVTKNIETAGVYIGIPARPV